ncbi:MAG TPA: FAD-dependent oxidoreductase [Methanospirillum sp.]|nr:FAD-dependent oxidoreductase [Methanospirillum sp.]
MHQSVIYSSVLILLLLIACITPLNAFVQKSTDESYDTIIIGAGISGLTAGFYLDDADLDLLILEKEAQAGGRTSAGVYKGVRYAQGTEYLGYPAGSLLEMQRVLGLSPVEIPEPEDSYFYDGTLYSGDKGREDLIIKRAGKSAYDSFAAQVLSYGAQYDDIPDMPVDSDLLTLDLITASEWMAQSGIPVAIREIYNVSSRGIFGANLNEISALSLIPEAAFDYENGDGSGAYTYVGGITSLTDALADHLGDQIQYNTTVTSVQRGPDGYLITAYDQSGGKKTYQSRSVILAAPAPVALKIASEILTPEQKDIMGSIPYAPYITLSLFSDQPVFEEAYDLALPDGSFATNLYDATWVDRHVTGTQFPSDVHIATAYISGSGFSDRSILNLTDEEVKSRVISEIDRILPGRTGSITGYSVTRFSNAFPVMIPGAYQRMSRLHDITDGTVQLAGDYMIYPTFESVAESGKIAAENCLDSLI